MSWGGQALGGSPYEQVLACLGGSRVTCDSPKATWLLSLLTDRQNDRQTRW